MHKCKTTMQQVSNVSRVKVTMWMMITSVVTCNKWCTWCWILLQNILVYEARTRDGVSKCIYVWKMLKAIIHKTKEGLEVCLCKKIVLRIFWIVKNTKCNSKFELDVRIIKQTNHQENAPWVTNWSNMLR